MPNLAVPFAAVLGGGVMIDYGVKHFKSAFTTKYTSSTGSTGAGTGKVPNTPTGGYTQTSWARALLTAIGAPQTHENITSILLWEQREGGNWNNTAKYNPLNTTYTYGGSGSMGGGSAVQAYTSWLNGLVATVKTLEDGQYNDVLAALRAGNGLQNGTYPGLGTWSNGAYTSV